MRALSWKPPVALRTEGFVRGVRSPLIHRALALLVLLFLQSVSLQSRAEVLFTTGDTVWKLFKGRSEASSPDSTTWRRVDFDDASWATAPAPFYYSSAPTEPPFYNGGPVTGTVLSDMLNTYTCVFLRKTFVITNAAALDTVIVEIACDDGFIVWLNGVEIGRTNMPAGVVSFNGVASGSIVEPAVVHSFVLDNGALWLREGTNVLAMQGFNRSTDSSDFGIMAGLSVSQDVPGVCFPQPDGLVAWWPLEGNGDDLLDGAALTFSGGPTFGTGKVGQAVTLDGANDFGQAAASADLNIGAGEGLSIEGWIKPTDASRLMDIVEWNNGQGSIGVHLATSTASSRDLYANIVDTAGVSHGIFSTPGLLQNQVFQHVALTYDKASGMARLYWNGTQVAQASLGTFTPQTSFDFQVGTRRSGPFQGIWFGGVIDELSLYRRALSSAEVQGIFAASAAGKCATPQPLAILTPPQDVITSAGSNAVFSVVAEGTPPLRYQWLFNGAPLTGATQFRLTLPAVQGNQAGLYSVVVSDVTGSVTSSPARLTVIFPLAIVTPPQSAMVVAGGSATFSVSAQGTGLLSYQWFFNDTALAGANDTTLTLANVQVGQAGRYAIVVSDATHSVTSAPAVLNVLAGWTPVITEFMAENDRFLTDEDGEASDWIEIFNPGPAAVNLQNWCLTDDPADLTQWRFPATNLAANAYLLVFASGKNRIVPGAPLHTNFRLDQDGDYLALVEPDGVTVASEFAPTFPSQRANVSFGLAGGLMYFLTPTPRGANNLGVLGFVADTKFSTNRGFFFSPVDVTVRSATPGATLVYTINGDTPTLTNGVQVPSLNATSPPQITLRLTTTTTLRAAAFKGGYVSTGVDTHTYIFPAAVVNQTRPTGASATWIEDPPGSGTFPADFTVTASVVNNALPGYSFTNGLLSIPTISVVSPVDGLFGPVNGMYTRPLMEGTNWERAVSVELIYPDGREGFHANAGAQMHGDVSALPHTLPKHPLRLFFRDKYGPTKLQYPLFAGPVDQFDQLILRGCSTDAWPISNDVDFLWRNQDATYQRDQWMRDAQLDMGRLSARGIYVHLYLNGLYWGLYNLTERINDSFVSDHLGGSKEEYDVIQAEFVGSTLDVVPLAGTDATWNQLLQVANQVPGNPAKYWEIQGLNPDGTRNPNLPVLLDMDNFIDYMLLHIYAAAVEWPNRNWWATRRRDTSPAQLDSTGFKFIAWDQEIALDRLDRTICWYHNQPMELVNQADTPGQVYDRLRNDAEFRLRFADHLQKHLFNDGALTIASNQARWAARAAEIDRAMVGESARWGDAKRNPAYTRETDWLRMSNFTQNTYWTGNLPRAWNRFRNAGLYPSVGAPNFSQFGGNVSNGFQLIITHTNATGTIYYTLDGTDPRLRGGAVAPTAAGYTQPIALLSPTLVRARVRSGTTWSALAEAQFYTPQDLLSLQLSEIMYNPPRFGPVDGDEVEFLELRNTGAGPLDLSGVGFTSGINFTFPNETVLAPGQFFVLARNAPQFAARYPGAPLHGLYSGKLENGGETLVLSAPFGSALFSVTYDDAAPWPAEVDNSGLSMQRMNFNRSATNAMSWIAAAPTPGGPLPPDWMDGDGDGIPNGWENQHGLLSSVPDSDNDDDQDGLTNLEEFLAGTDPQDGADLLRLETIRTANASSGPIIVLGFSARSNKTYTVIYRDSVNGTAWNNLTHVASQPLDRFVMITNLPGTNTPSRFYRLATPRQP